MQMRIFILKIALLVFSVSLFDSLATKSADDNIHKGHILVRNGLYMYHTASDVSRKTGKIPYNAEVQILEESQKQFNSGMLSCHWLKISYKGKTGYCPEMYLYKNKLPDTAALEHIGICDFLKVTNSVNESYCIEKPDSMSLVDSMFIKNISIANGYYYIRLLLNDKLKMYMPDSLNSDNFNYEDNTCKLMIKNTLSGDHQTNNLTLSWYFDGGLSEATFEQTDRGVSVKIGYYPD